MKVLIIGMLVVGLMVGVTVPALASSGAADSRGTTSSLSSLGAEAMLIEANLEALEEIEIGDLIPMPCPRRPIRLQGGLHGVWGTDNATSVEPPGVLAGIYGTARTANGTTLGFFGGIWRNENGTLGGYLKGRYANGHFRGVWRCLETGVGGPVEGTYAPSVNATNNATDSVVHHFVGKWATRDGQQSGYLRGTWAPLVQSQLQGRFAGLWVCDTNISAAEIAPDGRLFGIYGVIELADGSSIHYFRGKWRSHEGARGQLRSLALNGTFYGIWNSRNGNAHGYLKGVYGDHEFKGVWGRAGNAAEGRLWGRYGPSVTPRPVEEQPLLRHQNTWNCCRCNTQGYPTNAYANHGFKGRGKCLGYGTQERLSVGPGPCVTPQLIEGQPLPMQKMAVSAHR